MSIRGDRDCAIAFRQHYGCEPTWVARAPGRVNLIGGHVDYNDGWVLPMAIEPALWLAAAPASGDRTCFVSTAAPTEPVCFTRPTDATAAWGQYLRGVFAEFADSMDGSAPPPLDGLVHATLPIGGGLSSSAALSMATTLVLAAATGTSWPEWDTIRLCQRAERRFAGVPCGVLDPFASLCGRQNSLLLLDCRDETVEHVPIHDDAVAFVIIDSGHRHALSDGAYAQRRQECEDAARALDLATLRDADLPMLTRQRDKLTPRQFRRARHVVTENARTLAAAAAARAGNWRQLGDLLYAAHDSLRRDFEVSTRELDLLVRLGRELGRSNGVWGARMTGGGFGGSVVFLVDAHCLDNAHDQLVSCYQAHTGITATAVRTRPAPGAGLVPKHAWLGTP